MNKLFFVVNHASFFVSHRLDLAIKAQKEFDVFVVHGKPSSLITETSAILELKNKGIKTIPINLNNKKKLLFLDVLGFLKLIHLIINHKPKIVHSISPIANLVAGIATLFFKKTKLVMAISGMGYIFTDSGYFKKFISNIYLKLLKIILKKNNLNIIVQNNDDYKFFVNKFLLKNNISIIKGSGVDLKLYSNFNQRNKKKIVLFAGRLIKEKGVIEFLQASKIVKKLFPEWNFVVVGQYDYNSPSLLDFNVLKKEYADYVKFLGYITKFDEILLSSSIFCLPSYREGMPKVVLEASVAGCAIITTDTIGCKESIINNYSGELIPVKNSKILSDKLIKFINDEDLRVKYGKNARNYALKHYSIESVINEHLKLYRS